MFRSRVKSVTIRSGIATLLLFPAIAFGTTATNSGQNSIITLASGALSVLFAGLALDVLVRGRRSFLYFAVMQSDNK